MADKIYREQIPPKHILHDPPIYGQMKGGLCGRISQWLWSGWRGTAFEASPDLQKPYQLNPGDCKACREQRTACDPLCKLTFQELIWIPVLLTKNQMMSFWSPWSVSRCNAGELCPDMILPSKSTCASTSMFPPFLLPYPKKALAEIPIVEEFRVDTTCISIKPVEIYLDSC